MGEGGGEREVHVVVFRHCARSVSADVDDAAAGHTSAADYTDLPLPNWGVPPMWCTPAGMRILEGTGKWLSGGGGGAWAKAVENWEVMTDSSQRDVDSALALLKGLGAAGAPGDGSQLRVDASLFDAVHPDTGRAVCALDLPPGEAAAETKRLVDSVTQPGDYRRAAALVDTLAGVGAAGPVAGMPMVATIEADDGRLVGGINAVRHFAESIVLSTIGEIPWKLHRPATVNEILSLLSWQHWWRAVSGLTATSAITNARLLRDVVTTLGVVVDATNRLEGHSEGGRNTAGVTATPQRRASPHAPIVGRDRPDSPTTSAPRAKLYFGHDSNLDGLATLLQLRWASPPYIGTSDIIPTPPGSALHFAVHSDGRVTIDFWYPTFFTPNTTSIHPQSPFRYPTPPSSFGSASLPAGASAFASFPSGTDIRSDVSVDRSGNLSMERVLDLPSVEALAARVHAGLALYPSAARCFYGSDGDEVHSAAELHLQHQPTVAADGSSLLTLLAMLMPLCALLVATWSLAGSTRRLFARSTSGARSCVLSDDYSLVA